jgi:hypothetical protein
MQATGTHVPGTELQEAAGGMTVGCFDAPARNVREAKI